MTPAQPTTSSPEPRLALLLRRLSEYIVTGRIEEASAELRTVWDECGALHAEIERLTPRWQQGEPPASCAEVWREGTANLVYVGRFDGVLCYWQSGDPPSPWGGTARWSPIVRPS